MNAKQKRELQSFRRVQDWIGTHPQITTASSAVNDQLTVLNGAVQEVTTLAAQQDQQAKVGLGATAEAKRLRAELLTQHMRPIASIARATIPDVVKMSVELQAPAAKTDAEALFAEAEAMATTAAKYSDKLIARGLPADFVAQLRTVAEAYKKEIDARGQARGGVTGATTGLHAELLIGRKAVETMSVIIMKQLRGQPAALAEWKQIRRVIIKGVNTGVVPAPAPAAPATPATPATPAAPATPATPATPAVPVSTAAAA